MNFKKWPTILIYDQDKEKLYKENQSMKKAIDWIDKQDNEFTISFRRLKKNEIEDVWAYSNYADFVVPTSPGLLFKQINQSQKYIRSLPPGMLEWAVETAKRAYYNSDETFVEDDTFDYMEDLLKKRLPRSPILKTGVKPEPASPGKTELPYYMGSMNKLKDINNWVYEGPYLITEKLDGVSLLYMNDPLPKLYTRGNGMVGQNVTHLLSVLDLPKIPVGWAVRGELMFSKQAFKQYEKQFKNARNMMSGMVGSKSAPQQLKNSKFVVFEILNPRNKFSTSIQRLKSKGFSVPWNVIVDNLDPGTLLKYLKERKSNSQYDVDGLVIYDDNRHDVNVSGNPAWAFAFKSAVVSDKAKVKVIDIEWNISRHNQAKPTILFEPVNLSGVTIQRATGHNAKYIITNKIGPGAVIRITRSGDVIPYVLDVVKPAKKMSLPSGDWDSTKTNIIVKTGSTQQKANNLEYSIRQLGMENIGSSRVSALVNAGYDTLAYIMEARTSHLIELIGPKLGKSIKREIRRRLDDADVVTLMVSSLVFGMGFGKLKLQALLDAYPDIVTMSQNEILALEPSHGFSERSMEKIALAMPVFVKWMGRHGFEIDDIVTFVPQQPKRVSEKLKGNIYVFTGVRDKNLEQRIIENGGKIAGSFTRAVTHLVVKDMGSMSSKMQKARAQGTKIIPIEKLRKMI